MLESLEPLSNATIERTLQSLKQRVEMISSDEGKQIEPSDEQ
jgi:hypothetical protein